MPVKVFRKHVVFHPHVGRRELYVGGDRERPIRECEFDADRGEGEGEECAEEGKVVDRELHFWRGGVDRAGGRRAGVGFGGWRLRCSA